MSFATSSVLEGSMNNIFAFITGLVFGIGLLVAGMANPAKVLGFLDIAGSWDPSLGLVMAGAIAMGVIAFTLAKRRSHSLLGQPIQLPSGRQIDRRLIGGSVLFGLGWAMAGIRPGPSLVSLGGGEMKGVAFLVAMIAGMFAYELMERSGTQAQPNVSSGGDPGSRRRSGDCSLQPRVVSKP